MYPACSTSLREQVQVASYLDAQISQQVRALIEHDRDRLAFQQQYVKEKGYSTNALKHHTTVGYLFYSSQTCQKIMRYAEAVKTRASWTRGASVFFAR